MDKTARNQPYMRETEYLSLRSFVKQLEQPESSVAALVAAAVEQELTPRQKQMVKMYYIEQHTMRDIAKQLGVTPSTVTRTLQAARAKLQAALGYCGKLLQAARDEV